MYKHPSDFHSDVGISGFIGFPGMMVYADIPQKG